MMSKLLLAIRRFARDERGVTVTEYGLLLALVGVAAAAVIKLAGPRLIAVFQKGVGGVSVAEP